MSKPTKFPSTKEVKLPFAKATQPEPLPIQVNAALERRKKRELEEDQARDTQAELELAAEDIDQELAADVAADAPMQYAQAAAATATDAAAGGASSGGAAGSAAGASAGATAGATAGAAAAAGGIGVAAVVAGVAAVGLAAAGGSSGGGTTAVADTTPPAAPSIDVVDASDTGSNNTDNISADDTPTVRVTFNTTATDGSAVVAGDTLKLFAGSTEIASLALSAGDITNGYAEITASALGSDGTYSLTAKIVDASGNTSAASSALGYQLDKTAPVIQSMQADGATKTVTLTYNEAIDSVGLPAPGKFTVSTGGLSNPVESVSASGSTLILTLANDFASGASVNLTYADEAGDQPLTIQDLAGNDAAGFSLGVVADGYVRGAKIYLDANGDGRADSSELLVGVVTDANGNFFLPANANPNGYAIIAVGGVNIDTGIENTVPLLAPAGSTTVNPLTTLVQAIIAADTTGATDVSAASAKVVSSLGLPVNTDLSNYDPLAVLAQSTGDSLEAAAALAAQKIAAQVVALAALISNGDESAAASVVSAVATQIVNSNEPISLADANTVSSIITTVSTTSGTTDQARAELENTLRGLENTLLDAVSAINIASDLTSVSAAQTAFLDKTPPAAPTLSGTAITNETTPTVRIAFNGVLQNNGTDAVVGDTLLLKDGGVTLVTYVLTPADIAARFVELTITSSLAEGLHLLEAILTDAAGNRGAPSSSLSITIDTTPPGPTVLSLASDTGFSAVDGVTSNGTVNVAGLETGATWQYSTDSGVNWINGIGTSFLLPPGSYVADRVLVRQIDAAGNSSVQSSLRPTTVDTTAPSLSALITGAEDNVSPVTGNISNGGTSNDNTLGLTGTISGPLSEGDSVAVFNGAAFLGRAVISGTSWSFTTPGLANGANSFTVRVVDAAGNQGAASTAYSVSVNATLPVATANITSPAVITNDTTPTINGSVIGALVEGEVVAIYDGGVRLGTTVPSSGSWSFTPQSALSEGPHSFTVVVENSGGNQGVLSSVYALTIDTTAPGAPVILPIAIDNVISGSEKTSVISGFAEAGAKVAVVLGGNTRQLTADSAGKWSYTLVDEDIEAMGQGNETITVTATDAAGNLSAAATRTILIDTEGPGQPIFSQGDYTIGLPDRQSLAGVVISGTAEANAKVILSFAGLSYALAVDQAGGWSYQLKTADYSALGQGVKTLTAVAVDAYGNSSAAKTQSITIDTVAPVLTFSLDAASDTGVAGDGRSNSLTPRLLGTSDAEAVITIQKARRTSEGVQSAETVLSVKADTAGKWDVTLPPESLTEGSYVLTAIATDGVGNTTARTLNYVVDTSAPTLVISSDKTTLKAGETATITFTFSEDPGSSFSWNGTAGDVLISGGTLSALRGTGLIRTATFTPAANVDSVTGTISVPGGAYSDAAGNPGGSGIAPAIAIDTALPTNIGMNFTTPAEEDELSVVRLRFSEVVTIAELAGVAAGGVVLPAQEQTSILLNSVSFRVNPSQTGGAFQSPIGVKQISGLGTDTLVFTLDRALLEADVLQIRHEGFQSGSFKSGIVDLAGNLLGNREFWVGGVVGNQIVLDEYGSNLPITIRGNGGADKLIGTGADDNLIDGDGADTLIGGAGSDVITLVEGGLSITGQPLAFARDVIRIELGHSVTGNNGARRDIIAPAASAPTTSGFDILSGRETNDVLDLPSAVIAANTDGPVTGTANSNDGRDITIAKHSITSGIVTFYDSNSNILAIDTNQKSSDAIWYLQGNNLPAGTTVGIKYDRNGDGTLDSLLIYQEGGDVTVGVTSSFELRDTLVYIRDLRGVETAVLGNTAAIGTVQIIDKQAPEPINFGLITNGVKFDFAENVFVPDSGLAFTLTKNGTETMTISGVSGNGTAALTVTTQQSLAGTDWVWLQYSGTSKDNGLYDIAENVLVEDSSWGGVMIGGSGNNTINLSDSSKFSALIEFDINGFGGNDTIVGSEGRNAISGGRGADDMTGGAGQDWFEFEQGDSPSIKTITSGANNSFVYDLSDGVDIIRDLAPGEGLSLRPFFGELNNAPGLKPMFVSGSSITQVPDKGLVDDQSFYLVQGTYNETTKAFTSSFSGPDTLVVYDGSGSANSDGSGVVTNTGIVLKGVQPFNLNTFNGGIERKFISSTIPVEFDQREEFNISSESSQQLNIGLRNSYVKSVSLEALGIGDLRFVFDTSASVSNAIRSQSLEIEKAELGPITLQALGGGNVFFKSLGVTGDTDTDTPEEPAFGALTINSVQGSASAALLSTKVISSFEIKRDNPSDPIYSFKGAPVQITANGNATFEASSLGFDTDGNPMSPYFSDIRADYEDPFLGRTLVQSLDGQAKVRIADTLFIETVDYSKVSGGGKVTFTELTVDGKLGAYLSLDYSDAKQINVNGNDGDAFVSMYFGIIAQSVDYTVSVNGLSSVEVKGLGKLIASGENVFISQEGGALNKLEIKAEKDAFVELSEVIFAESVDYRDFSDTVSGILSVGGLGKAEIKSQSALLLIEDTMLSRVDVALVENGSYVWLNYTNDFMTRWDSALGSTDSPSMEIVLRTGRQDVITLSSIPDNHTQASLPSTKESLVKLFSFLNFSNFEFGVDIIQFVYSPDSPSGVESYRLGSLTEKPATNISLADLFDGVPEATPGTFISPDIPSFAVATAGVASATASDSSPPPQPIVYPTIYNGL